MAGRTTTGLIAQREFLLQEINLYRHAMRDHVLLARYRAANAGHNATMTVRAASLAPAAITFLTGLLKGGSGRGKGHRGTRLRGGLTRLFAVYALWKLIRK